MYVIDEVHMLTNEAFNALLKTLEEPPDHVIFVLCTTEPHRLPDTILSRCQRFDFKRATQDVVGQKLAFICEQEGLRVADDALAYLARRGAGSFRDAESLLDQVAAYGGGDISLELVQGVLGAVPHHLVLAISSAVVLGDVPAGFRAIAAAFASGADARQLVASLVEQLRALLLLRIGTVDTNLMLSNAESQDLRARGGSACVFVAAIGAGHSLLWRGRRRVCARPRDQRFPLSLPWSRRCWRTASWCDLSVTVCRRSTRSTPCAPSRLDATPPAAEPRATVAEPAARPQPGSG